MFCRLFERSFLVSRERCYFVFSERLIEGEMECLLFLFQKGYQFRDFSRFSEGGLQVSL